MLKMFGGRSYLTVDLETNHPSDAWYFSNFAISDYIEKPYNDDSFFFFNQSSEKEHLSAILETDFDEIDDPLDKTE